MNIIESILIVIAVFVLLYLTFVRDQPKAFSDIEQTEIQYSIELQNEFQAHCSFTFTVWLPRVTGNLSTRTITFYDKCDRKTSTGTLIFKIETP